MTISTLDAAIAGARPPVRALKASATAEGAGTWHSLFLLAGFPGAGATPPAYTAGSGYACSRTTQGALPFTNPVSGETRLMRASAVGATVGALTLYDRLWTCSGLTTAAAATLPITTPGTIPARDALGAANGDGVELWGEVYTAPGVTGATWTVSYTNQAGTAGRTATYTHPANAESVGQMFPFRLQAGDTGVRSVQSFTTSVSSGTAGSIGLTLIRPITTIPMTTVNLGSVLDMLALGAPKLYDDSCLALMVQCSATNTGIVSADFVWTQG